MLLRLRKWNGVPANNLQSGRRNRHARNGNLISQQAAYLTRRATPRAFAAGETESAQVKGDGAHTGSLVHNLPRAETAEPQVSRQLWERNWIPLAPVTNLDLSRPQSVMLLGQALVVWRHADRGWVVQRDVCPHRLAPLSEGRLEAGGKRLACAYHGWEFDEGGSCTKIPQLSNDPRAAATACTSPRSCVTSYPSLELDGLLFVWLDASREGRQAAESAPKPLLLGDGVTPIMDWGLNEFPVDFQLMAEQSMDPSHANFLHHGDYFRMEHYVPMRGTIVKDDDLLRNGFRWEHGAYEKRQGDMTAFREFKPPYSSRMLHPMPGGVASHILTFVVPVRPGVCRSIAVMGTGPAPAALQPAAENGSLLLPPASTAAGNGASPPSASAPLPAPEKKPNTTHSPVAWLYGLLGSMPHWLTHPGIIHDQDMVVVNRQEVLMRRSGLSPRDYTLNSKGDAGIAAVSSWLRQSGYPHSLWGTGPAPQSGPTYGTWPAQDLSLEQLLSRQDRHVKHCMVCQRGMKLVTAVCTVLTVAAGLAAVAVTTLAVLAAVSPNGASAVGGWGPLLGCAAAAVALAAAAVQGWAFREERFVTGVHVWRRVGGLSLVGSK